MARLVDGNGREASWAPDMAVTKAPWRPLPDEHPGFGGCGGRLLTEERV